MGDSDRMSALEQAFVKNEANFSNYVVYNGKAFDRLHEDLTRLVNRMDSIVKVMSEEKTSLKNEIISFNSDHFVSKVDFNEYVIDESRLVDSKISDSRNAIIKDISTVSALIVSLTTVLIYVYFESIKAGV